MSNSKIEIKIGNIEFCAEGDPEWLSKEVDKILSNAPKFMESEVTKVHPLPVGVSVEPVGAQDKIAPNLNLSMQSVASKFDSKGGQGLATAAASYLRFVKNKSKFSRDELLDAMKEATGYYSVNHRGNLSATLKMLISGQTLVQGADNLYSIHATREAELNAKLK